jgi:tRNA A-37 threonylcarbamoyl transferase component Bud32
VLERADHALVRADSDLPGLALVLDPECVHEQVAAAVGAAGLRLVSSRVEYLRYKPGTSVVATVRVGTDAGSCLSYVRAWSHHRGAPSPSPAEAAADRSKASRRSRSWAPRVDDAAMLAVAPAGCDLRLGGVQRVLLDSRRWLRRMELDPAADPAAAPVDLSRPVSVRELRYKPGRRWVGRVDLDGCPWGVAKVVRRPALEHAAAALRQAADAGADVAPLLAVDHRNEVFVSRWVEGSSLDPITAEPRLGEIGAALAGLHRTPVPPSWPVADPVATGLDALRAVRAVLPAAAGEAQRCLGLALAALADPPRRRVLAHGDLNAEQVVLGHSGPVLLDLDRSRVDEPLADVASWVAHARSATPGLDARTAYDQAERLLDGYAAADGEVGDVSRLPALVALALLQRSVEPFRYRRPGWPDQVQNGVRAALREVEQL